MSKLSFKGNTSGTGNFTLAAPNSNTDRTFNLPDENGRVLTDASPVAADKLTGDVAPDRITGALNATGSAPVYACRAWVNFDGTGTVAIRDSGNISSITDNGTGQYIVNISNAMLDDNYGVLATGQSLKGDESAKNRITASSAINSSSAAVTTSDTAENHRDLESVSVAIFR